MTSNEAVASHQIPEKRIKNILITLRDVSALHPDQAETRARLTAAGVTDAEIEALRSANLIAAHELRLSYHGIDYISEV